MNLGEKMRRGSAWLISGKTVGRVLEFCFGIALARILFPSDFGMLVTLQVFTGVAGFLAGGGLAQALVRFDGVENIHFRVVLTVQLLVGAVLYAILFCLAPYVAVWFENPLYADLLRVTALTFFLRPFNNIPSAILSRNYRFKELSTLRFIRPVVNGVASIWLALSGFGVWSLVLGGLVGTFVGMPILYWFTRWKPVPSFQFGKIKSLALYGAKFKLNDILVYFNTAAPNAFMSKFLGPAQLGVFNKAYSLVLIPQEMIVSSVEQTVFRGLSSVKDDMNTSRYIYFKTVTLLTTYIFPIYVLMFWFAEPFVIGVYGQKWEGAVALLQILTLVGMIKTISRAAGMLIGAQDYLTREIRLHIESLVLIVAGCFLFYEYGIRYIAYVYVVVSAYVSIRLTFIALSSISAPMADFLRALVPAIVLNTVLVGFLLTIDFVIAALDWQLNRWVYLMVLGSLSSAMYLLVFLYLPFPQLTGEVARIRSLLTGVLRG